MKSKQVEYIVFLDNLFSVVVDAPLDEDGEVDWEKADRLMEEKAFAEIQDAVFRMVSPYQDPGLRNLDGTEMQINVTDVDEDFK